MRFARVLLKRRGIQACVSRLWRRSLSGGAWSDERRSLVTHLRDGARDFAHENHLARPHGLVLLRLFLQRLRSGSKPASQANGAG